MHGVFKIAETLIEAQEDRSSSQSCRHGVVSRLKSATPAPGGHLRRVAALR